MGEYKTLDLSGVKYSATKMSYEEAVKDISPVQWPDSVISGDEKISVSKIEKDYENKCAKLEISS